MNPETSPNITPEVENQKELIIRTKCPRRLVCEALAPALLPRWLAPIDAEKAGRGAVEEEGAAVVSKGEHTTGL
jgi:hypothetical protein